MMRLLFVSLAVLASSAGASHAAQNPVAGDPDAVPRGRTIYRSRCAGCHGKDARGYVGPDLTQLWSAGSTDERVFQIVRRGVAGTEMPPHDAQRLPDKDLWQILAFVRSAGTPAASNAPGSAENGERVFRATCSGCHRVKGRGGQLGPDLSRIGSARSRQVLQNKIRGASDNIRPGYEPVTVVTRDGRRIRGVKKNEDEFSIQIMDTTERLQGFMKSTVAVTDEPRSLMPAYGADRLSDRDLDDLLRYLGTLRPTT
jgi:putative heme-binding domain-containing protein